MKGVGLAVAPDGPPEVVEHPLSQFGADYVRRLTSAGPETQTLYEVRLRGAGGAS